jgi:hypothetical protein
MVSQVRVGTKVKWKWGSGWGNGKVTERFTEKVTRTIKGSEVTRSVQHTCVTHALRVQTLRTVGRLRGCLP